MIRPVIAEHAKGGVPKGRPPFRVDQAASGNSSIGAGVTVSAACMTSVRGCGSMTTSTVPPGVRSQCATSNGAVAGEAVSGGELEMDRAQCEQLKNLGYVEDCSHL